MILAGQVERATELIKSHFPTVLRDPCEEFLTPPEKPDISVIKGETPHSRVNYTSQVSTNPVHVALNLRILAFIEAARTVPLLYSSGSFSSSLTPSSEPPHQTVDDTAHQIALIHQAQRLYAAVESLTDPRDHEAYRKELSGVSGLLAYKEPEKSPMAKYMDQSRREHVAEQVNSAILRSPFPLLPTIHC